MCGSNVNTKVLIRGRQAGQSQRICDFVIYKCYIAGFEDGERAPEPRNADSL